MAKQGNNTLFFAVAGVGAFLAARAVVRRINEYDFRGKIVLITGGSRGLGLVLAREATRQGARVAICARDSEELERARADLAERGADALALTCDLTNQANVQELVQTVLARWGRIDVLINNAGTIEVGPMDLMTLDDYQDAMQTNFWASLYTILAVLPEMKRCRSGRIVNITSIGGKLSIPHLLPYSASKFALVGLSEGLRSELAAHRIVVTTVCPGLMRTGSPDNAWFKGQHRAEHAWFTIGDALPFFSMSADRAARQIIAGCKRGAAEVVLSIPAQIATRFHGLFPGLTADVLSLVNRMLPAAGGIGIEKARGRDSRSAVAPSVLTTLSDRAAQKNNEMP